MQDNLGERILPGHKRRKTEVSHTKDSGGVVVSYKPTNYIRSKAKALGKAKEDKNYSHKERVALNYPKGFPYH